MSSIYSLFVNADRTILVRMWESGKVEIATRPDPCAVWGPPTELHQEDVA